MEATPGGGGIDATTETSGAGAGFGATGATDGAAAEPGGLLPPPSSLPENTNISKNFRKFLFGLNSLANKLLHFDPSTVEDL